MKKVLYAFSISLAIALCAFTFAGCGLNTSNIIGVWEVDTNGGNTYITRIEFKKGTFKDTQGNIIDSQGEIIYYKDGGETKYLGSWSKRSDGQFNVDFAEDRGTGEVGTKMAIATLAEGKLLIQHATSSEKPITIYYHKVSD